MGYSCAWVSRNDIPAETTIVPLRGNYETINIKINDLERMVDFEKNNVYVITWLVYSKL